MTTVDYLRIATWNFNTYTHLCGIIRARWAGKWNARHWLQYTGYSNADAAIFMGGGDQGGERHFVFHTSGENAQEFFEFLLDLPTKYRIYCTRIDLQQTIRHPEINLRRIYKVNPRKIKTWIESSSSTIYIGARTSDRFTRLYQKIDNKYLRLEHELGGKLARNVFSSCQEHSDFKAVLQNHFILSTNKCKFGNWVIESFNMEHGVLVVPNKHDQEEKKRALKRKITYLDNTETALEKYMNDHDLAERVRQMVDRLHRRGQYPLVDN